MIYDIPMLGQDEQQKGDFLWRTINPTEFDKTAVRLAKRLKSYYSWDLVNPRVWSLVGAFEHSGPHTDWLEAYISVSRDTGMWMNDEYQDYIVAEIEQRYGIPAGRQQEYVRAFRELIDEERVPDILIKPFSYSLEEMREPIDIVADVAKGTVNTALLIGGGVLAVYLLAPGVFRSIIGRKG